ncbi:xanthine dehydrogenase small subunit [Tepidicella xavieri]|uniref:xanthine dehydrogenase small subunit n=1 Tax=Tepidicella xavieri TaxID=360241 RepID=UPI00105B3167|nr:xanthine dehydrogenase small subunit [Tepidicella xavieri]
MKSSVPTAVAESPLQFVRRGTVVSLPNVSPTRTLLQVLREDLGLTGTKEGCNEGDCGACTVVIGEPEGRGLRYRAINSCIRLAHSVHGLAVWTVEDLTADPLIDRQGAALHPAQQALVDCHGSQCGFCTPGFVMSLFGMYQNRVLTGQAITRPDAQADLSGNLCRCTGYRPILDAACRMPALPAARVNERAVRRLLDQIPATRPSPHYIAPESLTALLRARREHPQAQVVAGCTDVGLWINKGHQRFAQVLDVTRAAELRRIERYPHHLAIGAGVRLSDAFAALVKDRPALAPFAERFAGLPVRQSGTLAGNVANGSPIGDSMPLLIALGASVVLMRWAGRGARGHIEHRELPLEDFYIGYRKNRLAPDEIVAWVKVPKARPAYSVQRSRGEWVRAYKVSKRFDDDISAVCLAVKVWIERGRVVQARVGAGGVAATPARAWKTEAALEGRPWNAETVRAAMQALSDEFTPISDMRASAGYRRAVLANLLWRGWLESQAAPTDALRLEVGSAWGALRTEAQS